MRKICLFFTLLALQLSFLSCKKDSNPTPTPKATIQGLWIGTYLDDRNTPEFFSLVIKPDGTLLVESKFNGNQQLGQGTWNLDKNKFTADYTYFWGSQSPTNTEQTCTATFDDATDKLTSGVWTNVSPNTNTGSFTVAEVN